MTTTGGLLAVHAHPDDETLASGGLLAAWARSGSPVWVLTCTRGEQGEVIGAELAHLEGDGPALAAHREQELSGALTALGVARQVFLDALGSGSNDAGCALPARVVDSGMSWQPGQRTGTAGPARDVPAGAFVSVDLDVAAGAVARLIDELEPVVVVTYDPGGGYGHPDHVRAHEVTMRAVELARTEPVVLWVSRTEAQQRGQWQELHRLAWARSVAEQHGFDLPDPAGPLPAVAQSGRENAVVVDVRSVREQVLAALRAHATQVQAVTDAPTTTAPTTGSSADPEPGDADVIGCYSLSNDVLAAIPALETYALAGAAHAERAQSITWPGGVWGPGGGITGTSVPREGSVGSC